MLSNQFWNYVALWHTADVQRLPGSRPLTGALPTFGAECRLRARTLAFGHRLRIQHRPVATLLQQAGVPEGVAAGIMGHNIPTMTYGVYAEGATLKQKAEAIERIDYPL